MSESLWTDADVASLEESAGVLIDDVVYEKRCASLDDRCRFLGLMTRLKTMAAKFKTAMAEQDAERERLRMEREAFRQEVAAFNAMKAAPEPELITFNGMRRKFGFQSAALRKITARADFPPSVAYGEHQQSKRYWNRQAVKEWFSSNPEQVQEALCG